jgi:hypothetical protein
MERVVIFVCIQTQLQTVLCCAYSIVFITQSLKSNKLYIASGSPPKEKFWVRICAVFTLHSAVCSQKVDLPHSFTRVSTAVSIMPHLGQIIPGNAPVQPSMSHLTLHLTSWPQPERALQHSSSPSRSDSEADSSTQFCGMYRPESLL